MTEPFSESRGGWKTYGADIERLFRRHPIAHFAFMFCVFFTAFSLIQIVPVLGNSFPSSQVRRLLETAISAAIFVSFMILAERWRRKRSANSSDDY
jgi:cytochrome b subunit of formate dehydrogenase